VAAVSHTVLEVGAGAEEEKTLSPRNADRHSAGAGSDSGQVRPRLAASTDRQRAPATHVPALERITRKERPRLCKMLQKEGDNTVTTKYKRDM
jgi:hypothetical protein